MSIEDVKVFSPSYPLTANIKLPILGFTSTLKFIMLQDSIRSFSGRKEDIT
jgi:hypothetical protein